MIVEEMKNSILQSATEGRIVEQNRNYNAREELNEILKDAKDNKKYKYEEIKEGPFEIPSNWVWVKLEDLCKKITDGTHSTPKYAKSGIPFISVKDVSSGVINFENTKYITKEEHDQLYTRCNPEYGDVLITKVGTTGVPAIVDTKEEFSLFVSVALLKINTEKIYNKFLVLFLNSPVVQKQVKENTRGVGNKNWVLDAIKNTILPLPPLEEQKRITEKIEELFNKLDEVTPIEQELNELKNNFCNNMINAIYQSAMSGKLTKQNSEEQSKEFLEKLKKEQNKYDFKKMKDIKPVGNDVPYEIPDNWTWERIGNIFEINLGFTYRPTYVEKGYKFLSVKDISSGVIDFDNVKYISKEEYERASYGSKPLKGDILFGRVGTIGVPQIVETDEPFCIFVSLGFLRDFTNLMNKKYVCYWMNSSLFKKQVAENVSGTAQINLNTNWLKNFYIPIPPIEEQQRVVDKIEKILPLAESIDELVKA